MISHVGTILFVQALALGFLLAVPPGPLGFLCVRRTLVDGRAAGAATGLGVATADALYGCVAGLGLTMVSDFVAGHHRWFGVVAGLLLAYLGVRTFFDRNAVRPVGEASATGLVAAFASALALTLTNPMTLVSFGLGFGWLGIGEALQGRLSVFLLVVGVFVGSLLWWLVLIVGAHGFRRRLSEGGLRWLNRVAGIVILAFAVFVLLAER